MHRRIHNDVQIAINTDDLTMSTKSIYYYYYLGIFIQIEQGGQRDNSLRTAGCKRL